MNRPFRILVAENDKIDQKFLQFAFAKRGHSVCTAQNGQEAIDLFRTTKIDIVVLDIALPLVSWSSVMEFVRRSAGLVNNSEAPIIVVSCQEIVNGIKDVLSMFGIKQILFKPIDLVELNEKLAAAVASMVIPVSR